VTAELFLERKFRKDFEDVPEANEIRLRLTG
jgi:hypothetical protein